MQTDEFLIEKTKKLYEAKTGWGDSGEWTNQDFVILSEKIQERTGIALSHVTLKRVWGKVKYESLPNTHTLDTLVQFLGYGNWREFKSQNGNGNGTAVKQQIEQVTLNGNGIHSEAVPIPAVKKKSTLKPALFITAMVALAAVLIYSYLSKPKVAKSDYSFSSKTVVSEGVPNSVVFNFDATKSPYDSVIIQQSWDPNLQVKVSKYQHQHTSIYYLPDYYRAKLIVGGKIVSMHRLLIKSNGWVSAVMLAPVPVYFTKEDAMRDGKLSLSAEKIQSRNIKMQPSPPTVLYSNVRDLGEIYSNDFVFETSVRNDYREGAAACQNTVIYLLCEGTAVGIPLCSKGCVSNLDLLFTNFFESGKKADLSAFGVDFNSFVKVRVESKNGKGAIYLNDKLVYTVTHDIVRSKIIGFDFSFQGTGSIDYVKLSNGKVKYEDDF
jgi:hypothetical protein